MKNFKRSVLLSTKLIVPPVLIAAPAVLSVSCSNNELSNNSLFTENKNLEVVENSSGFNITSLENGLETTIFSPNSITTVPGGVFVPTNKGAVLLDDETFSVKWTCSNTSIGATEAQQIYSASYVPNTSMAGHSSGSILVARKHDNNNIYLHLIDIETGQVYDEAIDVVRLNVPISDTNTPIVSKIEGATNPQFTFSITGMMSNVKRNENTYLISLNSEGFDKSKGNETGIERVSLFEEESDGIFDTFVFSSGNVSINNVVYSVNLQYYYGISDNVPRVAIVLTKMNQVEKELKFWKIIEGDGKGSEVFKPNKMSVPNIKVTEKNGIIYFSTVANIANNRNFAISGSYAINSMEAQPAVKLVSLENDWSGNKPNDGDGGISSTSGVIWIDTQLKENYDIQWGYYSQVLDCFVTFCNVERTGAVALFDLNDINVNSSFEPNSGNVMTFSNLNGPLSTNKNDQWIPFIPHNTRFESIKNANVLNMSNNSFKNKVVTYDAPLILKNSTFKITDFDIAPETTAIDYQYRFNTDWFLQNKMKLFVNFGLLNNPDQISNINPIIDNRGILRVLFSINNRNYTFSLLGFSDYGNILAKNSFNKTVFGFGSDETIQNVQKNIDEHFIFNNKTTLFSVPDSVTNVGNIANVSNWVNPYDASIIVTFTVLNSFDNRSSECSFKMSGFLQAPATASNTSLIVGAVVCIIGGILVLIIAGLLWYRWQQTGKNRVVTAEGMSDGYNNGYDDYNDNNDGGNNYPTGYYY